MDAARVEAIRAAAKQVPAIGEIVAVLAKASSKGIRALDAAEAAVVKDAEVAAELIAFDQRKGE